MFIILYYLYIALAGKKCYNFKGFNFEAIRLTQLYLNTGAQVLNLYIFNNKGEHYEQHKINQRDEQKKTACAK